MKRFFYLVAFLFLYIGASAEAAAASPLTCPATWTSDSTMTPKGYYVRVVDRASLMAGNMSLTTASYIFSRQNCYNTSGASLDTYLYLPPSTVTKTDNPLLGLRLQSVSPVSLTGADCSTSTTSDAAGFTTVTVNFSTKTSATNTCSFSVTVTWEVVAMSTSLADSTKNIGTGQTFNGVLGLTGASAFYVSATYTPRPNVNGVGAIQWSNLRFIFPSCTLSTPNLSVQLGTVQTTDLRQAGMTAGQTRFTIPLSSCDAYQYNDSTKPASWAVTATWKFSGPSADTLDNTATTKAGNVLLQLLDTNGTPISSGGQTKLAQVSQLTAGSGTTLPTYSITAIDHFVRYYATGLATPGEVKSTATLTLSYQ